MPLKSKTMVYGISEMGIGVCETAARRRQRPLSDLRGKLNLTTWTQLPTKTNAKFFFKNDLNTNYTI